MKISLITPAKKLSKSGNRATAVRWARMLRDQGHSVRLGVEYKDEAADVMIAIHAWRSAGAITRFKHLFPDRPLVLCLGGTDVNTFVHSHPETTLASMDAADALICLHDLIGKALPRRMAKKLHVVRQSAIPLSSPRRPAVLHFDICVLGHLRDEKDPFRAALAARQLPDTSRLRVIHLGKAHTKAFARQAEKEMARNPRYHWLGEVPRWRVRRELTKTRAMVISSNQEGGANVVSEAVVANVPVIASDIDGNVGLLGTDYEGYYPVRDEAALARLLDRAESDPKYLRKLEKQCRKLRPLFRPEHEARALKRIIADVT